MNSELTEPLSVCGIYNGPAQDPSSYIGCIRNYARGSEAFDGDDLLGMFADEDAAAKAFYTYWDKKFGSNGSSAGPQPEAPIEEAIEQPPKGDGRVEAGTVLGSIESRGEFGFEAFGPDKVSLGLFPDRLAAKAALGNPQPSEEQLRLPAVTFLEDLRPGGPWVLTAIVPDSTTTPTTVTAHTPDDVEAFVREHNGKAGLYYSVNPTRTALSKKAAKTNITAIEYVLGDLDPAAIETSEAAKARYLEQLNGAFEPKLTAAVDSGNGINGLLRLQERIVLGKPVNGKFSPEDQAKIDDVEARAATLMRRLGSKAGTQNIDRILRLPGTTNLPNAKKRRDGRTTCPTKLLWFDDTSYPLDAFPSNNAPLAGFALLSDDPSKPLSTASESGLPFEYLGEGLPKPRDESPSGYGYRFMRDCHAQGKNYEQARAAILADKSKAGEWANRVDVDERQLQRAWEHSRPQPNPQGNSQVLPSPNVPMKVARLFVDQHCRHDNLLTLHHWRGTWWRWRRSHWCELEDSEGAQCRGHRTAKRSVTCSTPWQQSPSWTMISISRRGSMADQAA
jgi:hypothetical protein